MESLPRRRWCARGLAGACALLVLCAACAITPPRSELFREVGRSDMTPEELRIRVRALAPRFSGLMESVANDVADRSHDPRIRLEMTRFKTDAIPIMQAALFQPDPVAALVDAWALLAQLKQALMRVKGLEDEALRQLALQRFQEMEGEVESVWRELSGSEEDVAATRQRVEQWAQENPLTGTVSARKSTVGLLANLTARSRIRPLGAAAQVLEDVGDLNARMDLQTTFLPRQARWQAELAMQQALTDPTLQALQQELSALLRAATRATRTAEGIPAFLARETDGVLSHLHDERLGLQDFIDAQRQAMLKDVRDERVAVLADVDRMSTALVDRSFDRAAGLLDRFFLWLLLTLGLLLVGGLLALWLVLRAWRRSAPARGEEP
ncbi:MAG: chemotaxis protein [Myxococcaceae bacterium]|nr:chemotaxis protein [Myxococcaceae bacterium]